MGSKIDVLCSLTINGGEVLTVSLWRKMDWVTVSVASTVHNLGGIFNIENKGQMLEFVKKMRPALDELESFAKEEHDGS